MQRSGDRTGISRRRILRSGVAAAGGLAATSLFPSIVRAADDVFVGITTPLTGPYSADGKDLQLGYELAIQEINAGGGTAAKYGLKGKGVLGKTITYKIADTETKPNVAVQAQTQFIHRDKAIMITGSVSSATAIALEELATREKVLNMCGTSGSNDTTGKNCQRYGFRSQPSAYMACTALGPVVTKALGKGRKVAYLVPDYTYGASVYDSCSKAVAPFGWTEVTKQLVPVGASDYSSALLNIANSGADVFVNACFAGDAVSSCKQAQQFGILEKMKLVVPNISSFQAKELGADIMQGVYGTMEFWWTQEDQEPLAKDFVQAFLAKNKYHPRWSANIGYMQMYVWALSVERAGSFDAPAVIKVLEDSKAKPYDSTVGKVYYRADDHQMVHPVTVVVGKKPSAMKNPEDFYDILEVVPGEGIMSPPDMFGCHLGPI